MAEETKAITRKYLVFEGRYCSKLGMRAVPELRYAAAGMTLRVDAVDSFEATQRPSGVAIEHSF